MFRKIIKSPYLVLFTGVILLVTSGFETWENLSHSGIGARHGVLFFSLIQIMKVLPDILDGVTAIDEAKISLTTKES